MNESKQNYPTASGMTLSLLSQEDIDSAREARLEIHNKRIEKYSIPDKIELSENQVLTKKDIKKIKIHFDTIEKISKVMVESHYEEDAYEGIERIFDDIHKTIEVMEGKE